MAERSKSNEIQLTREYDAPVQAVWDAWTDPVKVAKWWGPRGFSITTHSKDLRVGGHWDYTMHGPDGTDYPNKTTYLEVEQGRRLVYDHGASEDRPPLFRVTVVFTAIGDRTRMEMTMALATPEAAEETRKFIKKAGGNATWDRLGEYLTAQRSGREVFIIHRTFDAPIVRAYEAWTKPERLVRWLPPKGFAMEVLHGEVREGGNLFCVMQGEGTRLHVQLLYRALRHPERIVYDQQFTDANGRPSTHPLAPVWPEVLRTTVTFTAETPDRTRVAVASEPAGGTAPEALRAFVEERGGMSRGWTGSFDALEPLLGG